MRMASKIVFAGISWVIGIVFVREFCAIFLLIFLCGFLFLNTRRIGVVIMIFVAFLCGFLRFYFAHETEPDLSAVMNIEVSIFGRVSEEIVNYNDYSLVKIFCDKISYNGSSYKMEFLASLRVNSHNEIAYGDYIKADGFILSGNHMNYPNVKILAHGSHNFILSLREFIINKNEEIFSEPYSSFASALLIGARKGIPKDILDNFNGIGLTHIIAVSGYNITIVIACVFACFSFLSRKYKAVFSILFIVFFMFLAGASASVVRASLMGIIGIFALYLGRKNFIQIAIFVSMFFMSFMNPRIVVEDAGFQLSFLATLSLIYLLPILQNIFEKLPSFFGARDIFLATISSQFFTMPVILMIFNRFSVIAPIANVLILPFIPLVMMFSFIAFIAGVFWLFLGKIFGIVSVSISKFIFLTAEVFAGFNFSSFDFYVNSKITFIVFFMVILYVICKVELKFEFEGLSGEIVGIKS